MALSSLFVLDEDQTVNGPAQIYASDWQLAGYQIDQLAGLIKGNPDQVRRVAELKAIYQRRSALLSIAAQAALSKQGQAGIGYFYTAQKDESVRQLDRKLNEIIASERNSLRSRKEQSQFFTARPTSSPII